MTMTIHRGPQWGLRFSDKHTFVPKLRSHKTRENRRWTVPWNTFPSRYKHREWLLSNLIWPGLLTDNSPREGRRAVVSCDHNQVWCQFIQEINQVCIFLPPPPGCFLALGASLPGVGPCPVITPHYQDICSFLAQFLLGRGHQGAQLRAVTHNGHKHPDSLLTGKQQQNEQLTIQHAFMIPPWLVQVLPNAPLLRYPLWRARKGWTAHTSRAGSDMCTSWLQWARERHRTSYDESRKDRSGSRPVSGDGPLGNLFSLQVIMGRGWPALAPHTSHQIRIRGAWAESQSGPGHRS